MTRLPTRNVLFFCFIAISSGAASAEPAGETISGINLFVNSGQSLGNENTVAVAAADLDGDNDLDVFAANTSSNKIWVNDGSGQFTDSGQLLGLNISESVALADLDGDNDVDAVVANSFAPNQVWWNDGNGVFTAGPTFPSAEARGVAVGKLNDDDDPDIYIAETGVDHIYWNNGDGTFTDSGQALDAGPSYDVALGDLDGDGDLDAIIANGSASQPPDTVWINQGVNQGGTEGDFLDSGQQLGFIWTEEVALGELDGTPGLDAFAASWFPRPNKVWSNNGSGTFSDSGQNLGSEGSIGVSLGDVDGDGDEDAFVGNNTPDGGKLWINDGSGGFADSGQSIGANLSISGSVLADLNVDGAPDLFLAAFGPNQVWLNVTVAPALPKVGFQPQIADGRARAGESTSLALDADGNPHIAYTRYQLHRNGLNYAIQYTRWDGVRWHSERISLVDDIQDSDPYAVALDLDSAGNPHIAFATVDTINYARRAVGSWAIEQLVSGNNYFSRVSMALDSQDNPHIVYFNSSTGVLHYRYFDGANWISEIIHPAATGDTYHDIALDAAGNPHVSYYSSDDRSLRYAHRVSGNWQSDIVQDDPSIEDDAFTSIAVDSSGNPGIAYYWNERHDVRFARFNGASWNIETVRTVPASFFLRDRNALSFDSADNPHIIFSPSNSDYTELTYVYWDSAQWVLRVVENSGPAGQSVSMALDANDNAHLSYYDLTHQDLRYTAWGPEYETLSVDASAAVETTALGIRSGTPSIGFYDRNPGLVEVTEWDGDQWLFDPIASSSNTVPRVSAITDLGVRHFSHYDADNQRLLYTEWGGSVERTVVVDDSGDVGRFNDITYAGGDDRFIRIAYWDATNRQIKLAELNDGGPPVIHVNDQAPALNTASGYVAIAPLPGLGAGISYYDGVNGDLRYAAWDSNTNTWSDFLVDGAAAEAGRMSDIRVDATQGVPVMAYYDETEDQIKMAHGNGPGFNYSIAANSVVDVTSLSLSLNMNSRRQARILYSTADSNLYLAALNKGLWRATNLISAGGSTLDAASMALQDRLHFSYADSLNGLVYGFKASNLDFAELPGEEPTLGDGYYNPMDACFSVLLLFFGGDDDSRIAESTGIRARLPALKGLTGPLTDPEVFSAMTSLFNFTSGGQFYIGLYQAHGTEMGQIALDDPGLILDSYGTLQNFMPGLEAFVTGSGDELLIDQDMVDDALDVWTRVAAAGSPGLAGTIAIELAKYNNLQDFVGMSFDEWADAIGVITPAIVADTVFRNGFE